ncbi:MAG TPA: thiamine ABC transporter substrate-binding protein [Candidatus Thermoplasmatota archaeon]|nr:thiamine ABC transporter substrate-binding protein [Candidatus Thermoplasmatota archaeon]
MTALRPSARLRLSTLGAVLLLALLSGCTQPGAGDGPVSYAAMGYDGQDVTGRDPGAWPDLEGTTLTILDHGAFSAFDDAAARFTNLTGATVEHIAADDAGTALNQAIRDRGSPSADVIYGIDNVLLARAEDAGILQPYTPRLAGRVPAGLVFFGEQDPWPTTPVDHGYIGLNLDLKHPDLTGAHVADLDDVRTQASHFVTEDPNTSSVGLGFLLTTIATYGEAGSAGGRGWHAYWEDLFEGGALVTAGWTEAYEQHFSGGYGPSIGGSGDRPIVASYTESPAYEAFYGRPVDELATPLTAPNSTFQQVQTMAILDGTDQLAAAQAWIEFTLTDAFQELAAPGNAVYPVVAGLDVNATYAGLDPAPGTFVPAAFDYRDLGENLERWLGEWTALCEENDCR